jgi:putative tricarboxylic transport membrane protein
MILSLAMGTVSQSFGILTDPAVLVAIFLGVVIGIIFGAIPGFSATMTIILFTPVTIPFDASVALIFLVSAYGGAVYAGSIPAILINTPGAPGSVVTCWDGYEFTKAGRATYALAASAMASGVAGIIAAAILLLVGPALAEFALNFGPVELFLLAVFALTIIPAAKGQSLLKGLLGGGFGLLIATIGSDPQLAQPRAILGLPLLRSGVSFVVVLIGLFVFTEALFLATQKKIIDTDVNVTDDQRQVSEGIQAVIDRPIEFIRGTFIGAFIGSLPGAGADVANFISYNEAKRWASDPSKFGTGIIEGIIAADSSNNATQGGALIPTLTIGIPGSGSTAALLSAFAIHGLNPGPGLFQRSGVLVYALIFSLFLGNALILVFGLKGARHFGRLSRIPIKYIVPVVIVLAVIGAFAVRNAHLDVLIMVLFGLIGIILVATDYPLVSVVIGVIVGGFAEEGFVQGWIINQSDPIRFLTTSDIAIVLLLLIAFSLGVTLIRD